MARKIGPSGTYFHAQTVPISAAHNHYFPEAVYAAGRVDATDEFALKTDVSKQKNTQANKA